MKKDCYLGISEEGFHRVAYNEWGDADNTNTPLICVHGLTRNKNDFDSLAEYLSNLGRHVYCPDVVGRGDSDWMKNPLHYTYEQYIADMNGMITRTGAKQVDWLGTSLGGVVGMVMASQANSPIRRLILNDIGPQIPTKGIMRLARFVGKDPDFRNLEEAKTYYKKVMSDVGPLTDADWQRIAENSVREVAPGRLVAKTDHGVAMTQAKSKLAWQAVMHPFKAFEGTLFDIDLWRYWRKVTCPVLVIHGAKSDILTPTIIKKMQANHPNTEIITIPDAGHAPALMRKEEQEMIHQWLSAQD